MGIAITRFPALFAVAYIVAGLIGCIAYAQDQQQIVFHVLHAEETAVYIDVGRNSGLKEGTKLSLFHADAIPDSASGSSSAKGKGVAELEVLIVADSSAVCQILSSQGEVRIGDIGFITFEKKTRRSQDEGLVEAQDHPISMAFSNGDPSEDVPSAVVANSPAPVRGHAGVRIGLDYDATQVTGGFRASEAGFQISSDITKIAGTDWSFTGYWRSRFRETYSGLNGAQLESLDDRIDRTYHIGLYYDSPNSRIVAGFGRLSVPGAPSLATVDGGYFGLKLTRHVTTGFFAGSAPDPSYWDYNPSQRTAGTFTNIETGDFGTLHLSSTEGIALTTNQWQVARQFAYFENTISWKHYLWLYNSTQVDAARTSPVPGAGSNGTGISFTSSSLRFQPLQRLSVGLNHSYLNSVPTFDPNLLGTTLLDKYIFQGLSFDVRYELPHHVSLFTQLGRSKSIADTKEMWNKMFGISFGEIFKSGFHADLRYSQFDSSFGQGNYQAISISRTLKDSLQIEFLGGNQSLVSSSTANTASRFVTGSATWSLGPRYFFESGFTWSRGNTMNYQQWNTMFGYRFGKLRAQ